MNKPITIAITGPESTGKSWLAHALARHYGCDWVAEYAREYLNALSRPYTLDDVLRISIRQQKEIDQAMKVSRGRFLFLDTELTVTKVWCTYKYGHCPAWINKKQGEQEMDLYLLTDIDLPWQPDPLREHPDKRQKLFELYRAELDQRGWPYEIVAGKEQTRLENAIRIIEDRF